MALVAFASGLAGALLGAVFGAWAVRNDRPDVEPEHTTQTAELARRVEAIEHALANVEPGVREPPTLSASDPNVLDGGELAAGGPVLEATVVDLVGKPTPARDGARLPARQPGDRYWVQELTMQLSLTPAQTERLRTIQADLERELVRADDTPADRRHAARRALQRSAEQQLRSALAPRQLAAYEALEPRLKLYPDGAN